MELWELLDTPIDELYEQGILQDRIERNVKQNVLTFECCLCGEEYSETWARNNPDKLSRGLWCASCKLPTMFLKQATPSTIYYRSRSMEHGNLGENVSGECWQCGQREGLHHITFSNGQPLAVCSIHIKPFGKAAYQATQYKQACLAGLFNDIHSGHFDPGRDYTYQQLRAACCKAGYTPRILDKMRAYNQAEMNAAMQDILGDIQINQEGQARS